MCPFCFLTGVVVASSSISAGGVGAILIGKVRAKHATNAAGTGRESRSYKSSSTPQVGANMPTIASQKLFSLDEVES
jgi:hypothetical protein